MLARRSLGNVARGSSHGIFFPLSFIPTLVLSGVPTAPDRWKWGVCCCIFSHPQGREKAEGRSGPLRRAQSWRQAAEPFTVRGLALAYRPVYPKGATEEALGLWLQYFPSQENHPTSCAEQREENKRINWRVVLPAASCSPNPSWKLYRRLCRWYAMRTYLSSTCLPNMVPFYFSECITIPSHNKSLKNRWATRRKWEADCPACHSAQPVSHSGTNLVVFVMCTHIFCLCVWWNYTLWIVLQHVFHLMFLKHLHIFSNLSFAAEQPTSKLRGLR